MTDVINKENVNINSEVYSGKYIYNNAEYTVTDTFDVHQLLSNGKQ